MAMPNMNFFTRPNKHIQRRLIFDTLLDVFSKSELRHYRCVGFGGRWFVDFVLAHKMLGIIDMISIEWEQSSRAARFNQPYRCIKVEGGDSTLVLPEISYDREVIVWLDYTQSIDGPVLADLRIVCEKARPGSVVLATINAHKGNLKRQDDAQRLQVLRQLVGNLVPDPLPSGSLSIPRYPELLVTILFNHFTHCLRDMGREERFLPMFSIFYRDNAPMVTVGGTLAEQHRVLELTERVAATVDLGPDGMPAHRRIEVPAFTAREKAALDTLLPRREAPSRPDVSALGFDLSDEEIGAYHRYYLHYPIFGEIDAP